MKTPEAVHVKQGPSDIPAKAWICVEQYQILSKITHQSVNLMWRVITYSTIQSKKQSLNVVDKAAKKGGWRWGVGDGNWKKG